MPGILNIDHPKEVETPQNFLWGRVVSGLLVAAAIYSLVAVVVGWWPFVR